MAKKSFKALAVVLSVVMAFGCFAVVPAFATPTRGVHENVTFVDQNATPNYDTGSNTFEQKLAVVNATAKEQYGANLKLYGITDNYLSTQLSAREKSIETLKFKEFKKTTYTTFAASTLTGLTDLKCFDSLDGGDNSNWGTNGTLAGSGYDATTTTDLVYGSDRIAADKYDMLFVATLKSSRVIDTFYLMSHPEARLAFATYKVYVANSEATLFDSANEVCMFDYYEGYNADQSGNIHKFNRTTEGGQRTSEGQYWTFTGDAKPTGKYVGIKMYDAAATTGIKANVSLYDLGIYGEPAPDAATDAIKTVVTADSTRPVVCAGDSEITVTDTNSNVVTEVLNGTTYNYTVAPIADSSYTFDGWYAKTDTTYSTKLSSNYTYTAAYNGVGFVAHFTTKNVILNVEAKSGKLSFAERWSATGYTAAYAYDSTEEALVLSGNPDDKMKGGSLVTDFSYDGKSLLTTGFEPWTTYKMTVVMKTKNTDPSDTTKRVANIAFSPCATCLSNTYNSANPTTDNDYKEYSIYFNSGAADFTNGGTVKTKELSTNMFNYDLLSGVDICVKSFRFEKVNNVVVNSDANSTVAVDGNKFQKPIGFSATTMTANAANYGGTALSTPGGTWLLDQMAAKGIVGAVADDDTLRFTVTPDEGYASTVKVNGNVVAPASGNVYLVPNVAGTTSTLGAIDNAATLSSNMVTIDVTSVQTTKYYNATFVDRMGNTLKTVRVEEGTAVKADDIDAAAALVPEIYGYVKSLDDNGVQYWDKSTSDPINADTTFIALYNKAVNTYTVSYTKVNGSVVNLGTKKFDDKIVLNDTDATTWTLNGKTIGYGASPTVYVCGNMSIIASDTAPAAEPAVEIINSIKETGKFTTFAHIYNPEGKTIKNCGIIFVSGTTYDAIGDNAWTAENFGTLKYTKTTISSKVVNDFMSTLSGITTAKAVRRGARAYVTFDDDTTIYSDSLIETFNN